MRARLAPGCAGHHSGRRPSLAEFVYTTLHGQVRPHHLDQDPLAFIRQPIPHLQDGWRKRDRKRDRQEAGSGAQEAGSGTGPILLSQKRKRDRSEREAGQVRYC